MQRRILKNKGGAEERERRKGSGKEDGHFNKHKYTKFLAHVFALRYASTYR